MAFGRVCLTGDAAFALRPHAAAGTAKAAADAWALAEALAATHGDVEAALPRWERRQLAVGRAVLERTRRNGDKSQFEDLAARRPGARVRPVRTRPLSPTASPAPDASWSRASRSC
jgi:2-polyprenyl-6-methoxyphenol hydroxylase-like FAD-dependent oxidoreductase